MTKRSFGVDTTSLATAAPILPAGIYAGQLTNTSITMGSGENLKHLIEVRKEKKWNKELGESIETENYIIGGALTYGALLTSKKAIQLLQRDEPRIFGGQIFLNFNKETCQLEPNHILGAFLEATGLKEYNFSEMADAEWEYDENIEVPEELQAVPNIIDMLNAVNYYRIFFKLIAEAANGQPVRVSVITQPNYKDKTIQENAISRGTMSAPGCGLLVYKEDCENDLEG